MCSNQKKDHWQLTDPHANTFTTIPWIQITYDEWINQGLFHLLRGLVLTTSLNDFSLLFKHLFFQKRFYFKMQFSK